MSKSKSYVLQPKKKFIPPDSQVEFRVSFRHQDVDYEGEYAAVFSILGHENLSFSADSKSDLVVLLLKVALFIGSAGEELRSIPLGTPLCKVKESCAR
jgi:hypothetical protein